MSRAASLFTPASSASDSLFAASFTGSSDSFISFRRLLSAAVWCASIADLISSADFLSSEFEDLKPLLISFSKLAARFRRLSILFFISLIRSFQLTFCLVDVLVCINRQNARFAGYRQRKCQQSDDCQQSPKWPHCNAFEATVSQMLYRLSKGIVTAIAR